MLRLADTRPLILNTLKKDNRRILQGFCALQHPACFVFSVNGQPKLDLVFEEARNEDFKWNQLS